MLKNQAVLFVLFELDCAKKTKTKTKQTQTVMRMPADVDTMTAIVMCSRRAPPRERRHERPAQLSQPLWKPKWRLPAAMFSQAFRTVDDILRCVVFCRCRRSSD